MCLTLGAAWMFCCYMVFASLGYFALENGDGTNNTTIGYVMIVFACLFIAAFASTWVCCPTLSILRELTVYRDLWHGLLHQKSIQRDTDRFVSPFVPLQTGSSTSSSALRRRSSQPTLATAMVTFSPLAILLPYWSSSFSCRKRVGNHLRRLIPSFCLKSNHGSQLAGSWERAKPWVIRIGELRKLPHRGGRQELQV